MFTRIWTDTPTKRFCWQCDPDKILNVNVCQMQRGQNFVQQMTTYHELTSKFTNFYSKQKWATHDLKKVVDHVARLLNDG